MWICIGENVADLQHFNNRELYNALVVLNIDRSKAYTKHSEDFDIDESKWVTIYMLPHLLKVSNRVKELQYKIVHSFVATNKLLFKMKIKPSPQCNMCHLYEQTLHHLFFTCTTVRNFWFKVCDWIMNEKYIHVTLTVQKVLFGLENTNDNFYTNVIILNAKYFIVKCKYSDILPTINNFILFLEKCVWSGKQNTCMQKWNLKKCLTAYNLKKESTRDSYYCKLL